MTTWDKLTDADMRRAIRRQAIANALVLVGAALVLLVALTIGDPR